METLFNKEKIRGLCEQNRIEYLALFGSFARGEENDQSDIDLLVRFSDPHMTLFKHVAIEDSFSQALNRRMDLVSAGSLHPYLRDYVNQDLKVLYERR